MNYEPLSGSVLTAAIERRCAWPRRRCWYGFAALAGLNVNASMVLRSAAADARVRAVRRRRRVPDPGRRVRERDWLDLVHLGHRVRHPGRLGFSIPRHRLCDIDFVVSRTLVYGTLTAILGAFHIVATVLLPRWMSPLTGNDDLGVALSTLAALALFRPLRPRIQHVVDRRFYRRKYDAARR